MGLRVLSTRWSAIVKRAIRAVSCGAFRNDESREVYINESKRSSRVGFLRVRKGAKMCSSLCALEKFPAGAASGTSALCRVAQQHVNFQNYHRTHARLVSFYQSMIRRTPSRLLYVNRHLQERRIEHDGASCHHHDKGCSDAVASSCRRQSSDQGQWNFCHRI